MATTDIKKYSSGIALFTVLIVLAIAWSYTTQSSLTDSRGTRNPKQAPVKQAVVPAGSSGYSAVEPYLGEEITLDRLKEDTSVKAIVPKYLPPGAKLDIVRRGERGGVVAITQHYKIDDNWLNIVAVQKPIKPDYQIQVKPTITSAPRIKPDGKTETVPLRTNGVVYKMLPDGTQEPIALDSGTIININGWKLCMVRV